MKNKLALYMAIIMLFSVVAPGFLSPVYGENLAGSMYNYGDNRIAGMNRYETAYEIAKLTYKTSDTVIIVRGDSVDGVPQVVDGLTAGGLAGVKNAPILLVERNRVPDATKSAIKDLKPKNAVIIGGTAAVSAGVESELRNEGLGIQRISGANRVATAAEVAKAMGSAKDHTGIIVDSRAEVDSLLAGPLANKGHPILMVNNGQIPTETKEAIKSLGIQKLIIVGGTGVVSNTVEKELNNLPGVKVEARFGGGNRVETSIQLAGHPSFKDHPSVSIVNGDKYVDAVPVSTLGNPVVYFQERHGITQNIQTFLQSRISFQAIGGSAVVSEDRIKEIMEVMDFGFTRFTRHNYPLEEALAREGKKSSNTHLVNGKWVSPTEESIKKYLQPENFYKETRLQDDRMATSIRIAVGSLRVRRSANATAEILTTVSRDEVYTVLDKDNSWYKIKAGTHTGWVHGDFVHGIGAYRGSENTFAKVTVGASTSLNVRSGPSASYERIGSVFRDEVFAIKGGTNGWYQIQYYDRTGWVSGSFIDLVEGIPKEQYQFMELSGTTGISEESLDQLLENHPVLHNKGGDFKEAGEKHNINEIYLVAHALMQSEGPEEELISGVTVDSIAGTSEEEMVVYNVFGIEATGAEPGQEGGEFAYEQGWDSLEESILQGAELLSQDYINHATATQNTLYAMRWDPSNRGANPFSTNIAWAEEQAEILHSLYRDLGIQGSHFDISTYKTRIWPVPGYYRISSPYGYRTHPITGEKGTFHHGIDIPAPEGTPILAVKSGVVIRVAYSAGYGNWVEIDHGSGVTTRYAHNFKNIAKVGDVVTIGDKIAEVGTTGSSTGNHLHFEVRIHNITIDPEPWLGN